MNITVSNTTRLSLGSILLFMFVACINENKIKIKAPKKKIACQILAGIMHMMPGK